MESPRSRPLRPERQFDVSNVQVEPEIGRRGGNNQITTDINTVLMKDKGQRDEVAVSLKQRSSSEPHSSLAAFYPQSSFWSDEQPSSPVSPAPPSLSKEENISTNSDHPNTNSQRESINNLEAIYTKLNETLNILKAQEAANRVKITALLNTKHELGEKTENDEEQEVIFVNIWNNVNGELHLADKKPVTREEFDLMETRQDFSQLLMDNHKGYSFVDSVPGYEHGITSSMVQVNY